MISVQEAKSLVDQHCSRLQARSMTISQAAGHVLAEDVLAESDMPPFNQSSVDGYAIRFEDWSQHRQITLAGTSQAGPSKETKLAPGTASRIFTGAAIPMGADTIVMQEKTELVNGLLIIRDSELKPGSFFRQKGSDIKAGDAALKAGTRLSPASIGFLAAMGKSTVKAVPFPSIGIIVTGNEIRTPGEPLQFGEVYDANSFALKAALRLLQIDAGPSVQVNDEPGLLENVLAEMLEKFDLLLTSGGVSVGDYDFLPEAAMRCQIRPVFHKVKQRPGKPLYFGKRDRHILFGLPGNPGSVLTCFYEYVVPAIEKMAGLPPHIQPISVPLGVAWEKKPGLTHFLRGRLEEKSVYPLDGQESYRMRSFAESNCLIRLEEEASRFEKGQSVEVHPLPS